METSSARKAGLWRLTWAGLLFLAIGIATLWLDSKGWHYTHWELFIPGGIALSGAVQFVTGIPFSELSSRWDSLAGWQRGIFGVFILLIATVVIVAITAAVYVFYFSK